MQFKTIAQCNQMLGKWAAAQLGLTGEAATNYANDLVTVDMEYQTIAMDGISEQQVARRMNLYHTAFEQIESGK